MRDQALAQACGIGATGRWRAITEVKADSSLKRGQNMLHDGRAWVDNHYFASFPLPCARQTARAALGRRFAATQHVVWVGSEGPKSERVPAAPSAGQQQHRQGSRAEAARVGRWSGEGARRGAGDVVWCSRRRVGSLAFVILGVPSMLVCAIGSVVRIVALYRENRSAKLVSKQNCCWSTRRGSEFRGIGSGSGWPRPNRRRKLLPGGG